MAKNKENFLDYIPKHNALYEWKENEKKQIEIKVQNKGLFNRIAQILFRKPKYSNIELDVFGSFVWNQIDGKRSIYEIGNQVTERFGKDAEPIYERLARFIKILHDNKFVVYENKIKR